MRLTRIDVRFFRSFNFDYEHKARDTQPAPWEDSSPWFPFVRIPIEADITAVVGANESGKSQLLWAISAALTGEPIERSDFCRYSELYSVQSGEIRLPEFGAWFVVEEGEQVDFLPLEGASTFGLYRPGAGNAYLVVGDSRFELSDKQLKSLNAAIPPIHELTTNIGLPDSVSISRLLGRPQSAVQDRRNRRKLMETIESMIGADEAATGRAVHPFLTLAPDLPTEEQQREQVEFELARSLLLDIAQVDLSVFEELEKALQSGREGQVEAIVGGINDAIRSHLNVQRWWTQDPDFDLEIEAREHEVAFTIRDRTNAKYSFKERSQGLRFFLGYFIQLVALERDLKAPHILKLDEPDAFLSSLGQQDLLRVLHEYARPEGGHVRNQVVYVTHSPFLIDKNHPERIRVLEKGADDQGSRVVRDAANNRYEPLRSSLGGDIAETAFIGGQNLFVEGAGDQVLLAGISAHVASVAGSKAGRIDLNSVTIVASGGADGVPYMVYLARGRDTIKPACVALLDGDDSGKAAEKVLRRGEARRKRILKDAYIVRLDTWSDTAELKLDGAVRVREIEDLIPLAIVHRAALNHLARFQDLRSLDLRTFTESKIRAKVRANHGSVWEGLDLAFKEAFPEEHLEKVGLAREVINLLNSPDPTLLVEDLITNFSPLLAKLSDLLADAQLEEETGRADDRVRRTVKNFLRDHEFGSRKSDALRALREIELALPNSDVGDSLRANVLGIRRQFQLGDAELPLVPDFESFRARLEALANGERLAYQDELSRDPAGEILAASRTRV